MAAGRASFACPLASLSEVSLYSTAGGLDLTAERLNLTTVNVNLTGVRLDLTVERLNLTAINLNLTGVRLDLTVERLSLTTVNLDVTGVRLSLTVERLNLTAVNLNLTRVRLDLTVERLNLTTVDLASRAIWWPPVEGATAQVSRSVVPEGTWNLLSPRWGLENHDDSQTRGSRPGLYAGAPFGGSKLDPGIAELRSSLRVSSRGSVAETGNQTMDNELKAYLDQQFQQVRQETAEHFAKVDQRLDRSNQRQDSLVRGVDVLGIEFLGQARLVVESLANITQQLKRYDDGVSRELDEIRALNRLS